MCLFKPNYIKVNEYIGGQKVRREIPRRSVSFLHNDELYALSKHFSLTFNNDSILMHF